MFNSVTQEMTDCHTANHSKPEKLGPLEVLPLEILIYISEYFISTADLNALARTNQTLHKILNDRLYSFDAKHCEASALRWAAAHDKQSTALRSIAAGADLHCLKYINPRIGTCTPLTIAAYNGSIDVLRTLLVNESIEPNRLDSRHYRTPLHWAVHRKHSSIVRALIKDPRISVNVQDRRGDTALILAVNEYPEVVSLLLQRGHADPRIGCLGGNTPLSRAVAKNLEETDLLLAAHIQFLLDGDDSVEHCQHIFFYAAISGSMDILKYMVEYFGEKLDPNEARDGHGRGAFSRAAERNQVQVVRYLCKWEKTDPNLSDNWQHHTPLLSAVMNDRIEVVKALLECDRVDLEIPDVHGITPLCFAVAENHPEIVALLLSGSGPRRANPNAKTLDSLPMLYMAALFGHLRVVEALLDVEGIDPMLGNDQGITPLDVANEQGFGDIVERLEFFIEETGGGLGHDLEHISRKRRNSQI